MAEKESIGKKIILEFLDYLRFKVENDRLTLEEAESISRTIEENVLLSGTADDFAKFYGKPRENVKVVLCRKVLSKPRRMVLHSFNAFRKAVPDKWKSNTYLPDNQRIKKKM